MAAQLSQSGRRVTVVAVSNGRVFYADAGSTTWTEAANQTGANPPLNFDGIIFSAVNNQKLWFADGVNRVYFDPSMNACFPWVATAGSLPADSQNNFPRLICTWRGRTVQSGLLLDPANWFMSAIADPTNYDYAPLSVTPSQAIAGNNAPQGLIGDVVTSLCPFSDDVLIFFGDHSIYMMNGDPMQGGQIDLVSDSIGGTFGICWCKDPYGTIYFISNRTGVYSLVPGQAPQRISQAIESLLVNYDTGVTNFRLIWDDTYQGFHLFATDVRGQAPTTHLFWEGRSNAWWQDTFANTALNPIACTTFDGNLPGDRKILIGSWDGYVRVVSPTATDDDGTPIASNVIIGPILSKDLDMILCKDLQTVLGMNSGNVTFNILVGATAEVALSSTPVVTGTWKANRNLLNFIRRQGHAIYVQITATGPWSFEQTRLRLALQGKVQRRGP